MLARLLQIRQVPRVREAIQIDQLLDLLPSDDVLDDVRADEARAAGD